MSTAASPAYDAGSIDSLQLRAKLQENAGDFTGAEETRRLSVDLKPNDASLLTDLGTTLLHLQRFDEALDCYQRAAAIGPDQAGSHFGGSLVLAQLGRTDEALQAVERAIALRPGVAAYLSHRGHLLLRLGRQDEAVVALRSALEHDPDNAGIHNTVADILLRDHMSQEALYHAIRAAACAPSVARHQIRVAHLLTRHLRLVDTIEAYRRAIELQPNDWRLHAQLGALFVRLDRLEEAVAELKRALEIDAQGQVAFELSNTLLRMGKHAAAQEAIDRAVQLAPDEPPFRARQTEIEDVVAGRRMNLVASRFLAEQSTVILASEEFLAPACIRYTNFPEVNPQFGKHHVTSLYIEKRRWVPEISLHQLPADTTLAVPNGEDFIPLAGGNIVAEQMRRDWQYRNLVEAIGECTGDETIPQQAVLIGRYGVRTWGHWLGELLPKVVAVESRWPGRFSFIVPDRFVSDPVHKTALESLAYYGIGRDRLVLAPEKTKYLCANLYVVSPVWSAENMLHPRIAALMREHGPHDPEPTAGWLKAALLRRATRTRNIENIADVEKILVGHGFSLVDIEKLTFRQQVEMFKNASAIACVLGSGLTGLMYAPRGVKVLTLAPAEWGDSFFYSMMQERDAVFADIRGPTAAKESSGIGTSGFTVPLNELLAGVQAIGLDDDGADGEIQTAIVGTPNISMK
jgi:tetratricopeptide (TPR) repeat protein